jgi:CheY-like chemotaxis protein
MNVNSLKNIFLVDDDKEDQEFFIEALNKIENAKLYGIASNGKEALDTLKNTDTLPDFIFMDFNMPLMNGIECLFEITNLARTKNIPVFMLSSAIEQAEVSRKFGAKGFIKKTSDKAVLITELLRIINFGITVNYIVTDKTDLPCM